MNSRSQIESENGFPLRDLKTRFRITEAGNLVNQETTLPERTKLLKQRILRENAFTFPIITSPIPPEYRAHNHDKCVIDDGNHRKSVCEQLNLDVPEFRVRPDELTVATWSRQFREVPTNNFESMKRKFQLQPTTDCGIGNGRTVIIYKGGRYIFNPNALVYQNLVRRIMRHEYSRGVSISEGARNRFAEYKLSDLLGQSLGSNQLVEDEALNDIQLPERDVFIVMPRLKYKEIIEITYIAGFSLVPKSTRMVLSMTGRPLFLPIPLRFLADYNLTTEEKTQVFQAALVDIKFEELSYTERRKLAEIDRPYPEKLYAPHWTDIMRERDEWLWRHFREYN